MVIDIISFTKGCRDIIYHSLILCSSRREGYRSGSHLSDRSLMREVLKGIDIKEGVRGRVLLLAFY